MLGVVEGLEMVWFARAQEATLRSPHTGRNFPAILVKFPSPVIRYYAPLLQDIISRFCHVVTGLLSLACSACVLVGLLRNRADVIMREMRRPA